MEYVNAEGTEPPYTIFHFWQGLDDDCKYVILITRINFTTIAEVNKKQKDQYKGCADDVWVKNISAYDE